MRQTYNTQEQVPAELDLLGFTLGDRVAYLTHEGTITAFREPDGFLTSLAEAQINWGGQRSEWVSVQDLVQVGDPPA